MWKTFGAICSVIVLVSLLLMNTACYGPFNLTRSVHNGTAILKEAGR